MDHFQRARLTRFLEIVVREEAAVIVALNPMVEVDLIEVGANNLFPEFMSLSAWKGNAHASQNRDQGLGNPIWYSPLTSTSARTTASIFL